MSSETLSFDEIAPSSSREAYAAAYLSSRFYPPLPGDYVAPMLEALAAAEEGDLDHEVRLPEFLNPKPRAAYVGDDVEGRETWYVTASDLCQALRLDRFYEEWLD